MIKQTLNANKNPIQYDFYDRLKAEFPSQVLVDVTEKCNLACIHCPHPVFKNSEHYASRSLNPELNAKLVDEVRQYGQNFTQYIRYAANGEPLTHPDIYEMIDYATRNSGVMVTLTTNGTLLTEKRIERLLATNIDVIDISVDAFKPETYAKIRVNGNLNITQANILKLIEMSKKQSSSNTKVVVSYVEQPQNFHETNDFEVFWKDHGAEYVIIRRLHSCSGAKTELAEVRRDDNATKVRRPCLYPWERIVLNPNGALSFCPSDWVHGSFIANYSTTTIHETWQGEFYHQLREAHLSNNFNNHQFCGQCPDWEATRWPGEGRSYANLIEEFKDSE